jgi:hypothetical protein
MIQNCLQICKLSSAFGSCYGTKIKFKYTYDCFDMIFFCRFFFGTYVKFNFLINALLRSKFKIFNTEITFGGI